MVEKDTDPEASHNHEFDYNYNADGTLNLVPGDVMPFIMFAVQGKPR